MSIEERKLSLINKSTALNPNAVEFVPSCLRSVGDASNRSDTTKIAVSGSSKDSSADQPESIPSNPDEEAHRYWQQQLPDDITPDFKVVEDETPGPDSLSLVGLSMNDGFGTSVFSPNQASRMQHHASPFVRDALNTRAKMEFPGPEQSQATIMSPTASTMSPTAAPWVKTIRNGGQYSTNRRDASQYNGDSSIGSPLQNTSDAYYRNRRSLRSTMDIMTQLEQNKVDGRLGQNLRSLSFGHSSPPSPVSYSQNGLGNYNKEAFGLPNSTYRSHSAILADDIISPSAGREHVSLDSPRGRYKTTNLPVSGLGSSRGSQLLSGSYNGNHDMISNNALQNITGVQTGPSWLETDATANMFLEKDEVHDFASLRHALLEQDRQAFLTGGNPLAKDLNLKELYAIQSRLAQEKARETMYHQRFPMPELQGLIQEQNPPIDLCGLHASEAMHVLNYELNNRRKIARSTGRRLQVIIISSARSAPARLTAAVEQYLLEHGLQYTQAQPGLFRILLP
ncbi:polyadenylate-binding protein-interacting protein 7 isoform X3 [Brachypodium distachyon]|uniref:Smr domain-containing protein n=1 Tax=Brachypodium distachyon TaxID=15368 RepID=A0A0Q3KFU8_BRADI|nr:polyadenylate-binding protein-interacting protein 7 isoform X3 [Brachypodium distachyon]KQK23316.1 hypothetical protein BRADI_1g72650v3 [Brachypodium distachyon]KQK23321.1 hypothetical protein BRADI_1g72650v3 [Brachypodium distachyon]|eukprot:XP_014752814.1 polyadenylate-binding protein-interacting protein 7 isoform X3 [Brachypodium distachyon]